MQKLSYQAIGLMSGTSLDGLDIAFCTFEKEHNQAWHAKITQASTIEYPKAMQQKLRESMTMSGYELQLLDVTLGRWMGEQVQQFVQNHQLKPQFIASHGHTVFHEPAKGLTLQIGNPNFIHAVTNLPVISDFRTLDVAKGGQGAPLVPVGDSLLFPEYAACINLGGIANISIKGEKTDTIAFDICACNIVLNHIASHINLPFDDKGVLAQNGQIISELLDKWNSFPFLKQKGPKSLGREDLEPAVLSKIDFGTNRIEDLLSTAIEHISSQIANVLLPLKKGKILLTGGGTFNDFLIQEIRKKINKEAELVVPNPSLISYKEAFVFAFLGVLNVRKESNALHSVTGADSNSICGQKLGDI